MNFNADSKDGTYLAECIMSIDTELLILSMAHIELKEKPKQLKEKPQ
jgi:hypothetical protein